MVVITEAVYSALKTVALRIYAIHVYYCRYESYLSAVNIILTHDGCSNSSSIVYDLMFSRSDMNKDPLLCVCME